MASVSVSAPLPLAPEKTWDALSELSRWEDWLTIHQGWKSELPTDVAVGVRFTEVDAPHMVTIAGVGMAGVKVQFVLRVDPGEGPDSAVAAIDAEFKGTMIVGPIGKAVAKHAKADLETSLAAFAELYG